MSLEPGARVVIEVSRRELKGLAAPALAAEAVSVFEAARQHLREPPDLHVQRLGDSDIHSGTPGGTGSDRIIAEESVLLLSPNRWFSRLVHFGRLCEERTASGAARSRCDGRWRRSPRRRKRSLVELRLSSPVPSR